MSESTSIELPSQENMLAAVGRGIQAFATVEAGVGFVFASLMEPADRMSSILVLDAARNIEPKLKIAQAVIDYRLTGAQLARGRKLIDRVRKRNDIRNKLAHWTVSYWPGASSIKEVKKQIVVLAPPIWSKDWGPVMWSPDETNIQPLKLAQVEEFAASCGELVRDLAHFSNERFPRKRRSKKPKDSELLGG